jgi:hypothetical protein
MCLEWTRHLLTKSSALADRRERACALADRLNDTNKQLGGLSMTVGYQLEDRAYRFLPGLLRRDYEIELEEPLRRDSAG